MSKSTFAVAVRFRIHPDHAADFLTVVQRQAANSLAREPDCHQFDVGIDENDPCQVFLYETYTDATAFENHRKTDHFAEFSKSVEPWIAGKELATWKICEPEG